MIFVTVGTSSYPFDRLLQMVDDTVCSLGIKEHIIAQIGPSSYTFMYKNIQLHRELPFDRCMTSIKKARVIITHGGAGTILQCCFFASHKPFVIPRQSAYHEHVDDHQTIFTAYMAKKHLIKTNNIKTYLLHPEKNHKRQQTHLLQTNLQMVIARAASMGNRKNR